MATWRETIEDGNYQKLSIDEKIKTKNEFFNNIILRSDKFKSLPAEKQNEVASIFFLPKTEEGLKPLLPAKPSLGQIAKYAIEEFQSKSPFALLDKPVEEAAKFIEPDTLKPGVAGAAEFFPRQIAAEMLRGFSPSTAGMFGVGMKLAKPALKPVGKFIAGKTEPSSLYQQSRFSHSRPLSPLRIKIFIAIMAYLYPGRSGQSCTIWLPTTSRADQQSPNNWLKMPC